MEVIVSAEDAEGALMSKTMFFGTGVFEFNTDFNGRADFPALAKEALSRFQAEYPTFRAYSILMDARQSGVSGD